MEIRLMRRSAAAVLAWITLTPLLVQAQATCKEKLAAVDSRLAVSDLGPTGPALQQMRDQGATLCAQGQDAMAIQILDIMEMSLPRTTSEVAATQQDNTDSKAVLTNEFLAGVWCSMTGVERSQLVFSADGAYRGCVHDAAQGAYGRCLAPEPTAKWLNRYKRVKTAEQDTIVIGGNGGDNDYSTFKRGECTLYGR